MNRKRIFALITSFAFVATLAAPVASGMTADEMQALITQLTAQITQLQTQLTGMGETTVVPAFTGIPAEFTFATNLRLGSSGDDVKYLQIVLNGDPATQLAASGVGSPGQETSYFGPLTEAGVVKFQNLYATEVLAPHGLTVGTGFVGATTRAKLNDMLLAATEPVWEDEDEDEEEEEEWEEEEEPVVTGLNVSLSSDNPASGVFVNGQSAAELARFNFEGNATVTQVGLQRIGVSNDATLANVYLFDGYQRLTDAATVTTGGAINFSSAAGLFDVEGSKVISVVSDIAPATAGQTVGVNLTSVVSSESTVNGLPISGSVHSIANATLANVTFGTVTPSGATIDPDASV